MEGAELIALQGRTINPHAHDLLLFCSKDFPKSEQTMPRNIFGRQHGRAPCASVKMQPPRSRGLRAVVWRRVPSTSSVCGHGWCRLLQRALCADPLPSIMGRKEPSEMRSRRLQQPLVLSYVILRRVGPTLARRARRNHCVLLLGRLSAHIAVLVVAEDFF